MGNPVIYGDWGTTSCRLWLVVEVEGEMRLRDGVRGPGIKFCIEAADDPSAAVEAAYADMIAGWTRAHGPLTALLCGTVGANIGWVDAGYVPAPATLADICKAAVRVEGPNTGRVSILPGVNTSANAFGQPDVMRSEEIQVFGWLAETGREDARLCLPGSHTKWVEVRGGRITGLTTGFVGELFQTLREGSILAPAEGTGEDDVILGEAFDRGVAISRTHPSLVSAMFGVRAEAADNTLSPEEARDRLSGLLTGSDCIAMVEAWDGPPDAILGDGGVAEAYRHTLSRLGHEVGIFDGERAVLAGLRMAAGTLAINGA